MKGVKRPGVGLLEINFGEDDRLCIEQDRAKVEMDALDFGNLVHATLEAMGNDESMRDCTDAGELRDFLQEFPSGIGP